MYPAIVAWFASGPVPWLAYLVPRPGFLYGVVLLACGLVFVRRATRTGYTTEWAMEALLATAVGLLIGTRLFFLVTRTRFWEMSPLQLIDATRGTASWGGYLGGILGLAAYAMWRRERPLRLLDIGTSVAPLSDTIGRINCWITGDDYGRVTDGWWGLRYPAHSLAWNQEVRDGLLQATAPWSLPLYPNTLLLGVAGLLVFLLISRYWERHRDQVGRTTAVYLVLYGATRFPIEFLRDPAAGGATGLLSHSQYMCLAFIACGTALWFTLPRRAATLAGSS